MKPPRSAAALLAALSIGVGVAVLLLGEPSLRALPGEPAAASPATAPPPSVSASPSRSAPAVASGTMASGSALAVPASAPAMASASAPPVTASSPPPPPPVPLAEDLERTPLPARPTPEPKPSEWKDATPIVLAPSRRCAGQRLREWIHVTCEPSESVQHVALLVGDEREVRLATPGEDFSRGADIVLPLRRGKTRAVTVTSLETGRYSSGLPDLIGLLWVSWDEGAPAPTVRFE